MREPTEHTDSQARPLERESLLAALQRREQFLSGILGGLESFITVDDAWRVTFANAAALRTSGLSEGELLGRDLRELARNALPHLDLAALGHALREGKTTEFEVSRPGGDQVFRCTACPLADGGVAFYARDVTEQERDQAAKRSRDELYRELVESVNSAVLRWTPDGMITFFNDYAEQLFGWRSEEVVGGPVTILLPESDSQEDLSHLAEDILEDPERYRTNVNENVTRDGRRLWMAWTNKALRDEEGSVTEVLAIGNDITELIETQQALRKSEERYRTIVELADEDLTVSADGTYSFQERFEDATSGRFRSRAWLTALAAGARQHRLSVLLAALAVELAFLVPMGLSPSSRHILGMPGSLLALTVVVAAVLAGRQVGIAAAIAGGFIFWATVGGFGADSALATTVVSTGIWVAAALLAGTLTESLTEQLRLRRSAAVALARSETLREQEAARVAQEERGRIARDLHDSVTQALFAATLKAEALAIAGDQTPTAAGALEDVRRLSRGALAQMRTMLLELRGDPVADVPLQQLLRHLVEAAESRASVEVVLSLDDRVSLPPRAHEAAYRIAQEALTNVVRHAKAENAWVQLRAADGHARLIVGDDGQGFDPAAVGQGHCGLALMRERARETGAGLSIASVSGEGTAVTADWPTA